MKVIEGLRLVQQHFPDATMPLGHRTGEGIETVSRALHELAMKRPQTKAELIRAMDELGLGIHGNRVELF